MTLRLPELHTLPDVAARLHKTERWTKERARSLRLGRKAGRTLLFTEGDVEAILNDLGGRSPVPNTVTIERPWRYNAPKVNRIDGTSVYFIVSGPHVKIGTALDVRRRFSALQIAHADQLDLVFQMPGGPVEEMALHKRFAKHRVRGEWFVFADEIREWIAGTRK